MADGPLEGGELLFGGYSRLTGAHLAEAPANPLGDSHPLLTCCRSDFLILLLFEEHLEPLTHDQEYR